MSTRARTATLVGGSLVLGAILLVGRSGLAGEEVDTKAAILKIAALIEKGDKANAQTEAKALAKKAEVEEVMHLFKPRKKTGTGGIGVGSKAGQVTPDGIEAQFQSLGRDEPSPASLKKAAPALEKMGYETLAIIGVTASRPPEKDEGKKTAKLWNEYSKDTAMATLGFLDALKSNSPAAVHKAADKVNTACSTCHMVFRD